MENIKVNITNIEGKRSSTTLNFVICENYYLLFSDTESLEVSIHESIESYKLAIAFCAQSHTNHTVQQAVKNGFKGIDQYYVESNMIEEIINFLKKLSNSEIL